MYNEPLSGILRLTNFGWVFYSLIYAVIYLIFNILFCLILGALRGYKSYLVQTNKTGRLSTFLREFSSAWPKIRAGAKAYYLYFRTDPIAFIWPFTVLALPIIFFGISHNVITVTVQELSANGFALIDYRLEVFKNFEDWIPWIAIGLGVVEEISEFIRYRNRPDQHWFSSNIILRIISLILFNFVVAYVVINLILMWLDFGPALYRLLSDHNLQLNFFHPDQMYGFKSAIQSVIVITIFLVISSILPTVILLREKRQKYRWIYYAGLYGGLLAVFILNGALIFKLDSFLASAHSSFLKLIVDLYQINAQTIISDPYAGGIEKGISLLSFVKDMPDRFPLPGWLTSILGLRTLLLVYELAVVFLPSGESLSVMDIFERLFKKIAD